MSDLSIKKVALRHLKKEARLPKELMLLQQQILQAQSISDQIEEVVEGFKSHYASVQVKKNSQKQRRVAKNIKDQLITQYSAASVAKATIEKMQDAYSMLSSFGLWIRLSMFQTILQCVLLQPSEWQS